MMKKMFLVMLLGVVTLQSCVSYRIKVVDHGSGYKYYFPQKRVLFEWQELASPFILTLDDAKNLIKEDRQLNKPKPTYIKYKDL